MFSPTRWLTCSVVLAWHNVIHTPSSFINGLKPSLLGTSVKEIWMSWSKMILLSYLLDLYFGHLRSHFPKLLWFDVTANDIYSNIKPSWCKIMILLKLLTTYFWRMWLLVHALQKTHYDIIYRFSQGYQSEAPINKFII